ncbi:MAG: UDP-glucose 4-epimerase [Parcubacteria group bacterium Gr01-1014_70]|nr:MAG: UDP-glucose 4-epimerase [Parcubacteria group bacterium Gr01-1014_70]
MIDDLSTGKKENINPKAVFHHVSISHFEAIAPIFKNAAYVFHAAANARIQPSIIDPRSSNESNITGTLNVLVASRDAKVKKVIYSASSSAYGTQKRMPLREDMAPNPQSPYAIQKLVGEIYCKNFSDLYKLPTVSLRYFNVYGPRQLAEGAYATVIGIFFRERVAERPIPIVQDGRVKRRDYTHVLDIVEGNMRAMKSKKVGKGEILNLGTHCNYSVVEVARHIGGPFLFIPKRLGEAKETLADNSRARRLLGWKPKISFEDGIAALKKEHGLA